MNKKKDHHHHAETPAAEVDAQNISDTSPDESAPQGSADNAKIEQLQKQLAETETALADAKDKMLRALADIENMRRRNALDVESANKFASEKFARELLNIVDSLELGLQAVSEPDQTQIVHLREGMELTYKLMLDTLAKFQIKQLDPKGEVFDPKQHEALTAQPTEELEPNRILNVVQKGYSIYDRVLRPARVIVAKAP